MRNLLHGDNLVSSRHELQRLVTSAKQRGIKDIHWLDGRSVELATVITSLESTSLFGTERLVVIEDLAKRRSKKEAEAIISYLNTWAGQNQAELTTQVVLWEGKLLTAPGLKKRSQFTAKAFKISPLIFKFADSLSPQKRFEPALFNQVCEQDTAEFVFVMLVRQVRLMLQVLEGNPKLALWQIGKLKQQATAWGLDRLLQLQNELLELDYRQKMGQLALPFQAELELLLITQLVR